MFDSIKLGQIASIQNRVGAPANMRDRVCKKRGLKLAKADELDGWGVTFGQSRDRLHQRLDRRSGRPQVGDTLAEALSVSDPRLPSRTRVSVAPRSESPPGPNS